MLAFLSFIMLGALHSPLCFEGRRRRGLQKTRWVDGIIDSVDMSLSKLWETVKEGGAWRAAAQRVGYD